MRRTINKEDLKVGMTVYGGSGAYWNLTDPSRGIGWILRGTKGFQHSVTGKWSGRNSDDYCTTLVVDDGEPEFNEFGEICL